MNIANPNPNSAPLPWQVSLALLDLVVGHKHTRASRMSWSASSGMGLCASLVCSLFSSGVSWGRVLSGAVGCCRHGCRVLSETSAARWSPPREPPALDNGRECGRVEPGREDVGRDGIAFEEGREYSSRGASMKSSNRGEYDGGLAAPARPPTPGCCDGGLAAPARPITARGDRDAGRCANTPSTGGVGPMPGSGGHDKSWYCLFARNISGRIHLSSLSLNSDRCQTRSTKFLSRTNSHTCLHNCASRFASLTLSCSISRSR